MVDDPTAADADYLAERFDAVRDRLRALALRVLGSAADADDAVQEAWLRVHRSGIDGVDNLTAWLTTVVGRICLDMLRTRRSRAELPLDLAPEQFDDDQVDPQQHAILADSVGLALLAVLDTLAPAERLAFVLHDLFAVPFEEIAPVLERSPQASRQLASRARRRVQGADTAHPSPAASTHKREIVDAFLAAARGGDLQALIAVLDPDVVVRSDRRLPFLDGRSELHGRQAFVDTFLGHASDTRTVLLDGEIGAIWEPHGAIRGAMRITVVDGLVTALDLVSDRHELASLDVRRL